MNALTKELLQAVMSFANSLLSTSTTTKVQMCLKLPILFLKVFCIVNITTKDYTIPYQTLQLYYQTLKTLVSASSFHG